MSDDRYGVGFQAGIEAAFQMVMRDLERTKRNAAVEDPQPPRWPNVKRRTVAETIALGMPYVEASGITSAIYHQLDRACLNRPASAVCPCGVDGAVNGLAIAFAEVLDKFGRL